MASSQEILAQLLEEQNFWATVGVVLNYFASLLIFFTFLILLISTIFFLWQIFKKQGIFMSAYYYILIFGYSLYVIMIFLNINNRILFPKVQFFAITFYGLYWYFTPFVFFWNSILALNRFTAIFFLKGHHLLWQGWPFKGIVMLIVIYPFVLNGYSLFQENPIASLKGLGPSISAILNVLIACFLGLATVFVRQIKRQTVLTKHRYENYLLVQSLVATVILLTVQMLNFLNKYFAEILIDNPKKFIILALMTSGMAKLLDQFYYLSTIGLIFCLSKQARQQFIAFYRLNRLFGTKRSPTRTMSIFVTQPTLL